MSQRKFVFLSAVSGNILEYYDFTVYSVFSLIIGKTFFPATSEFVQILSSLAVFAIGFLTRPIGGIVFGYIGDRYGRRISLIFSMLGMTIPTFAMSIIPDYNEIGYFAPILLVIFRLIQGLCISGEGAGAAIFVLEHYNNARPGLITGFVHGSNIAGTLIASLVGIIIERYFSHITNAWRFAFVLGGIMGIIGFYLRVKVSETPIFASLIEKKRTLRTPFLHILNNARAAMFLTFCVGAVTSSIVYLVKSYINVFYSDIMHFDHTTSLSYLSYASFILMISMPVSGYIVDIVGKAKVLRNSIVTTIFTLIPILKLMGSQLVTEQILAITLLSLLAGTMSGASYIFVISLFKPEERFLGVAFSYNLGVALFGGTSPAISRWLVEQTQLTYSPAFYIIINSVMFLVVLYKMRTQVATIDRPIIQYG